MRSMIGLRRGGGNLSSPRQQRPTFATTTTRPRTEHSRGDQGDMPGPGGQDAEPGLLQKMVESATTTFASVVVLGVGFAMAGYVYHKSYKYLQLKKIENAFEPGDPVLVLAAMGKDVPAPPNEGHWITRPEQDVINSIIDGTNAGHYYLLLGDKGCGKSSMLLEAMRKIDGVGCAMFEAHANLEIFRIRLGKALDYEFHEDYIGGYFSERGPRESTALLDIERALNKLEKVALRHRATKKKPLILIINQTHLLRDDDDGKDLLELLQQRAEQWAAANLVTMVFNSDDYWVYERLKQLATRMEVLSIMDLPKREAMAALQKYRSRYHEEGVDDSVLEEVYARVGGRLSFLNRVAKSRDMLATCDRIKEIEKTWFLNQCWILGREMDDDVMDQQKWASASMVLALALVDKEEEMDKTYDPDVGHVLPWFPMHKAQEIMTRADFIRELDRRNLFTITSTAQVRASSVPMHRAFREICSEPGFREFLEDTINRIAAIESILRTRELVAKDLVFGGKYELSKDRNGKVQVSLKQPFPSPYSIGLPEDDEDGEGDKK
ncbi:hypothetical protein DL766_003688 [Monosporascus sp. MC13-8B]|uniref:Orc1-like AAA ATPase domain-containing protein n=1 Tax=Monosporascus cannonballus TaxID=155416 RepID=A0ABY0GYN4_9PEZI|nr:hypothetical protein DL762_007594 [Monosporascus cannonballus]RYO82127.1 hypothetical protein DL763_008323 [Monosporascus cannonballus]RYP32964.1 hypothetical protein DL766_003688 [Monosporascus sp. MC13-8B]